MRAPKISIVVAVFNGASTLQQCIDSVSSQSHPGKQLIIVDGGSTDGTVEICADNADKIDYWVSEKDSGIFNAWNKGLKKATGDWICFQGADDYFQDSKALERMCIELQKIPQSFLIAYGQVMLIGLDGKNLYAVGEPWLKIKSLFTKGLCLAHQGVMHRREFFEIHGDFDETFRVAGDYEILLRELKERDAAFVPGVILSAMRQGGLSSQPSTSLLTMREIRRAQKMHGCKIPSKFWILAMLRVYVRLFLINLLGNKRARKLIDKYRQCRGLPNYWTRT